MAVKLNHLTTHQARYLLQEQRLRRRIHMSEGLSTREIAVELGILTSVTVEKISDRLGLVEEETAPEEFLSIFADEPNSQLPHHLERIRVWLAASIVPAAGGAYIFFNELEAVITAIHYWVGIVAFFEVFRPVLFRVRSEWYYFVVRLMPLGAIVCLTFMVTIAANLRNLLLKSGSTHIQPEQAIMQWHRFLEWTAALLVCALIIAARTQWRKYLIGLLEVRIHLLRRLGKLLADANDEFAKSPKPSQAQLNKYIHQVLQRTALVMQLHPWSRLLKHLVWWEPAMGEIATWFAIPNADGRFDVVDHAAPGASEKVSSVLKQLCSRYRPVQNDVEWCQEKEKEWRPKCQDEADFIRTFRNLPGRSEHTSLGGRAFLYRTILSSRDPDSFRFFDDSFVKLVDESLDPLVADWLNVKAFAAASVNALGGESASDLSTEPDPYGVIVVWKCGMTENSISVEDVAVLATATRILSGIIYSWRQHQSDAKNGCGD